MVLFQQNDFKQYSSTRRGTSPLERNQALVLSMRMGVVVTQIQNSLLLGRFEKHKAGSKFDLQPYGAQNAGVSRHHASITRDADGHLFITDLESANGTYVNEFELQPHVPHALDNGDVIRLGRFVIHFMFK